MARISAMDITSKYDVLDIINALRENRDIHQKDYAKALVVYKSDLKRKLEAHLQYFESGELPPQFSANFGLDLPQCEVDRYNKMIKIFSLMKVETIELGMEEANKIFNDEWDWVSNAKFINSTYLSSRG